MISYPNKNSKIIYLIGLTGGIGSGKSAVDDILKTMRIPVIDCDKLTKLLYDTDMKFNFDLIYTFGYDIGIMDEGLLTPIKVDKKKLAGKVFDNPTSITKLNNLCFPYICDLIKCGLELPSINRHHIVFIDAPTLFETSLNTEFAFNEIWTISVSRNTQLQRIKKRNPELSQEDIEKRIDVQISDSERRFKSDVVIYNDGSKEELEEQVVREVKRLQEGVRNKLTVK